MRLRTSYIIKAYTAKGGQWSRKVQLKLLLQVFHLPIVTLLVN
jgi:hypothetical protein